MKANACRELTNDELADRLRELRQEGFALRMQQASARLDKPSRMRELRREIARVQTVQTERKRGGA